MCVSSGEFACYTIDPVSICMVSVKAELELDINHDQNEKCQTYGKSSDIDNCEASLSFHVPEGRDQVMLRHDGGPVHQEPEICGKSFKDLETVPAFGFWYSFLLRYLIEFLFQIASPNEFLIVSFHDRKKPSR